GGRPPPTGRSAEGGPRRARPGPVRPLPELPPRPVRPYAGPLPRLPVRTPVPDRYRGRAAGRRGDHAHAPAGGARRAAPSRDGADTRLTPTDREPGKPRSRGSCRATCLPPLLPPGRPCRRRARDRPPTDPGLAH